MASREDNSLAMLIDLDTRRHACDVLAAADKALARAYDHIGIPEWRSADPHFESIARTVTYQLVSTRAASAIWARVLAWSGGKLEPNAVIEAEESDLRGCGLSGPKVRHLKSIATAIENRSLPLDRLSDLSDADARRMLLAVKGIGPWTADIYLMSALGRLDAFPQADVGLMEAYRMLSDAEERDKPKAFLARAETWRPFRAVAAHLLWGYINAVREKSY